MIFLWVVVKVKTKERCFDIKKLGAVGETILHLCILNDTDIHIELAKKIIMAYPKMVNDYYIGDEYYGEYIQIYQVALLSLTNRLKLFRGSTFTHGYRQSKAIFRQIPFILWSWRASALLW